MRAYVCACVRVRRKVEGEGEAERISASGLVQAQANRRIVQDSDRVYVQWEGSQYQTTTSCST